MASATLSFQPVQSGFLAIATRSRLPALPAPRPPINPVARKEGERKRGERRGRGGGSECSISGRPGFKFREGEGGRQSVGRRAGREESKSLIDSPTTGGSKDYTSSVALIATISLIRVTSCSFTWTMESLNDSSGFANGCPKFRNLVFHATPSTDCTSRKV